MKKSFRTETSSAARQAPGAPGHAGDLDLSAWRAAAFSYPPRRWLRQVWPTVPLPTYHRDMRTTCFHEAGHAVIALVFGVAWQKICVRPDGSGELTLVREPDSAPGVDMREIPAELVEEAALQLGTFFVSGTMCELILHRYNLAGGYLLLGSQDWRSAERVLSEAWPGRYWRPMYYVQRRACAILADAWSHVERIASLLEERGTITKDELAAEYGTASENSRRSGMTGGPVGAGAAPSYA